jgi:hypothetical protein
VPRIYHIDKFGRVEEFIHIVNSKVELMLVLILRLFRCANINMSSSSQWRNIISGGPRFKIFEGPPSRSAKGTS